MNGKATTTGTDTRMSHSLEGHEYPRVSAHPIAHEDDGEGKGLIFGKDFPFPERGFDHEAAGCISIAPGRSEHRGAKNEVVRALIFHAATHAGPALVGTDQPLEGMAKSTTDYVAAVQRRN